MADQAIRLTFGKVVRPGLSMPLPILFWHEMIYRLAHHLFLFAQEHSFRSRIKNGYQAILVYGDYRIFGRFHNRVEPLLTLSQNILCLLAGRDVTAGLDDLNDLA